MTQVTQKPKEKMCSFKLKHNKTGGSVTVQGLGVKEKKYVQVNQKIEIIWLNILTLC